MELPLKIQNMIYVHATRLKNQILENVPCLRETKKGKFTLHTLDYKNWKSFI